MFSKLLIAWCLMALCVSIHASGVSLAIRWLRGQRSFAQRFWPRTWLFVRLAGWTVLLHLFEIMLWGLLYFWTDAMADLHSAFYFSTVTYTTTGYGDLVLPREWRFVGGVEALTGLLMCGWSTGFFFAVVSKMYDLEPKGPRPDK